MNRVTGKYPRNVASPEQNLKNNSTSISVCGARIVGVDQTIREFDRVSTPCEVARLSYSTREIWVLSDVEYRSQARTYVDAPDSRCRDVATPIGTPKAVPQPSALLR